MIEPPPWNETYLGGTENAEQAIFRVMIKEMFAAQQTSTANLGVDNRPRMMFGKTVVGITNASLKMDYIVPADLAVHHFHPGALLPAIIRLSNASHVPQTDNAPDLRGLSVRLALPYGIKHDMVFANFPTSLTRNAEQFFQFSMAQSTDQELLFAKLVERLGSRESRRIAMYLKSCFRLCSSLAREHFWSGSAFLWGDRPVRVELRPTGSLESPCGTQPTNGDTLRIEFAQRLACNEIRFRLALQRYVDEKHTPIEDAAYDWKQSVASPIEIGTLTIPQQDILGTEGIKVLSQIDKLAFSPWNAPEKFRPLGSLNRLRRIAYEMGANNRLSRHALRTSV